MAKDIIYKSTSRFEMVLVFSVVQNTYSENLHPKFKVLAFTIKMAKDVIYKSANRFERTLVLFIL